MGGPAAPIPHAAWATSEAEGDKTSERWSPLLRLTSCGPAEDRRDRHYDRNCPMESSEGLGFSPADGSLAPSDVGVPRVSHIALSVALTRDATHDWGSPPRAV